MMGQRRGWLRVAFVSGAVSSVLSGRVLAQQATTQAATARTAVVDMTEVLSRPVTLELDGVAVKQAIKMLASHAHATIQFRSELLESGTTMVTLHANKMPLGVALEQVLRGTGLRAQPVSGDLINLTVVRDGRAVEGIISGKVIDGATKNPLRGAVVTIDDAKKGVTTSGDGTFRCVNIVPGDHVVRVRLIGYAKAMATVVVRDGEVTPVTITLTPSLNTLDQVVVTGTVIPTELKAVPTAITVITGKELEERGITRIDQLFRGDVPGLFVQRVGSLSATGGGMGYPGGADVWSRGTANLSGGADGIKTYVDGVELADKSRLGLIDPTSIERVEILTGPQAATIYGSGAINGVIQFFTKRGVSSRPQLTVALQSAWTQNDFNSALAPKHTADLSASGVEGRQSYNVGGSWGYIGSWSPSVKEQTLSGFGGERITMGLLTLDVNLRVSQDQNSTNARDDGQAALQGEGEGPTAYVGGAAPLRWQGTSTDRAMGGTVTYPMTAWWSHTTTVGLDQFTGVGQKFSQSYSAPVDSTLFFSREVNHRLTAAYNTTLQVPMTALAKLILTLGVDESHTTSSGVSGDYVGTYTAVYGGWRYGQNQSHEHGGFLQSQLGVWDALFFQYGLRAVYNPNIGTDQNPNWEPHYGITYSRDISGVTAKVRASYGTATRPPGTGLKDGIKNAIFIPAFGTDVQYLANPDLVPESQQGGEGGIELYIGTRGSLQVTRFNQTVNDLIINAIVDSVDRSPAWKLAHPTSFCVQAWRCPLRQQQFVNIGSVRNQGWQGISTLNLGVFTVKGTYSWTKSRMIGIAPKYRGQWPQFAVGAPFNGVPEHTYAIDLTYAWKGTHVQYNLQGQGVWRDYSYDFFYRTGQGNNRSQTYQSRMVVPDPFYFVRPGYYLGDLNVSQQFTRQVEGLVRINNVHNSYLSESNPLAPQTGRTTGLGLRVRL